MNKTQSTTIALTREELCILDAAFEVLLDGSGVYMMLRAPELIEAHDRLFKKFHEALQSLE